jgi:hypothetical protein
MSIHIYHEEVLMNGKDPFAGSWKLNPGRSQFSLDHRPTSATMCWERTGEGYVMTAEGITHDGKPVKERPRAFKLDEKEHPIEGEPGLVEIAHHPDANTIHVQAKNVDHVVGEGSYIVSADGTSLIAAVSGADAQQRRFLTVGVWDRQ